MAKISSESKILDVGCGSGTLVVELSRRFPLVSITGIDADPQILVQARRKDAASRVHWLVAKAASLPFADRSFSQVFCTLMLHHLRPSEKLACLHEIKRVLKPGGECLFADFGRPATLFARLRFLPVQLIDGWQRTACNVAGRIPGMFHQVGFAGVTQTFAVATPLGTIRCIRAESPASPASRI